MVTIANQVFKIGGMTGLLEWKAKVWPKIGGSVGVGGGGSGSDESSDGSNERDRVENDGAEDCSKAS